MGQREKAYGNQLAEPQWEMPSDALGLTPYEAIVVPALADIPTPSACPACVALREQLEDERQRRKALLAALVAIAQAELEGGRKEAEQHLMARLLRELSVEPEIVRRNEATGQL